MWTIFVCIAYCIITEAQSMDSVKQSQYKVVDDINVTTLPIDVEFDQVSFLSCAHFCSSSNKTCQSYIYNEPSRHCILGSWLVPLKASQQKVQGKIFSNGKFCNTTRNITVLSDGSISYTDFLFCTGQRDLCLIKRVNFEIQGMCDTVTDGGGWTIFQRRVSGTVDFYRNWTEYQTGFGDFSSGNFYLGNENIYFLMLVRLTELRVDMIFSGTHYFAKYSMFYISSESDGYMLYVDGYTGNAGDYLAYNSGMMFLTYDRDNDMYNGSCAVSRHGAWWFKSCIASHLNGGWGTKNLFWSNRYNATFIEMKFRAVKRY